MAKVKLPLMSMTASGNFASGSMQVRSYGGYSSIYKPPNPIIQNKQEPSTKQRARRNLVRMILAEWRSMTQEERDLWRPRAAKQNHANHWAAYLSARLKQEAETAATLYTAEYEQIFTNDGHQLLTD